MRTIFSCMWPSCTRNCDSLDDIEQHVRSHLGHKQYDSIGDEDFYYEETEVDEATYLAIFDHHQQHAVSLSNGRASSSEEIGHEKQISGGAATSGQLSPSHNSDGLSSGRSFTSSSPASSPVCSTDSSQSSPSASVAASAMTMHHHQQQPIVFSQSNNKSNNLNAHNANGKLTANKTAMNGFHPLAGLNHSGIMDNPLGGQHNGSSTTANYWFTSSTFQAPSKHQQQLMLAAGPPNLDYDRQLYNHFSMSSGRGLATSAYRTGNNGNKCYQRGQRKKQRNERHHHEQQQHHQQQFDDQPLQFSLDLGSCASPEPPMAQQQSLKSQSNGRQNNDSRERTRRTSEKFARSSQVHLDEEVVGRQQAILSDPMNNATPMALVDHTYNSPPPARPSKLSLDFSRSNNNNNNTEKQQRMSQASLYKTQPISTDLYDDDSECFAMQVTEETNSNKPRGRVKGRRKYQPTLVNHDSQAGISQSQSRNPKSQLVLERPMGNSRRRNHLNHEIFQYQLPGKRGAAGTGAAAGTAAGLARLTTATGEIDLHSSFKSSSSNSNNTASISMDRLRSKEEHNSMDAVSQVSSQNKRSSSQRENRKCRKVYGMDRRDQWCTQCKWKKACSRFCDQSS